MNENVAQHKKASGCIEKSTIIVVVVPDFFLK